MRSVEYDNFPLLQMASCHRRRGFCMLFRDTIQEYEFDCCSRKMAPRAVGGYIKMLGYLADYLEQNHKITELEEIKGIHIKKFLMEKE